MEVSAGNEGSSCGSLRSPGDYDNDFTTGATQAGGSIWSSSSRGPSPFHSSNDPNVCAPGANIRSSVRGDLSRRWNGTSMSGPHVAGLVALMWSANSSLIGNVSGTENIIEQTANSTSSSTCSPPSGIPNNLYGWGEIDCYQAVVQGMSTPTPTITPGGPTLTPTNTPVPTYCAAQGVSCDEFTAQVVVGTINNSSGCDNYMDNTALSTNVNINVGYAISVINGDTTWPTDQCGIWVDWNRDYDFNDAGETIAVSGSPGTGPYTATITPPGSAVPGPTRMRIRILWNDSPDRVVMQTMVKWKITPSMSFP